MSGTDGPASSSNGPHPGRAGLRPVYLTAKLACPVCSRSVWGAIPRRGDLWLKCEHRACKVDLFVLVLEPHARGLELAAHLGEPRAAALLRRLQPAAAHLEDVSLLWELPLTGDTRGFLVVPVRGRERHLHQYADLPELFRLLGIA